MATFSGTAGNDEGVNRIDATVPQLGTFTGGTLAELTDTVGDTINGLGGRDVIVAGSGADTIDGGTGNDIITGGAGADNVTGGGGADTIILNAGDAPAGETLTGGGGADALLINGAVDVSAATVSSIATIVFDAANGGTLTTTHTQASNFTTFTGNAGTTDGLVVNMGAGNTSISLSAKTLTSIETITVNGSAGNNTIAGTAQADTVNAGDGTDTITAGNGSDIVDGGNGTDTAIWTDTRANITLQRVDGFANRWIATDINTGTGDEGSDTVSNVENFQFAGPVVVAVSNFISLQADGDAAANSVAENAANGTQVNVDVNATAGAGATITYAIVSGNGDGAFAIDSSTGIVTVANGPLLDFETLSSRAIVVRATAAGGNIGSFTDKSYTIAIADLNEAPVINEGTSDLTPSGDEDTDITGSIVATDVDVGDTLTYAVETGGEPLHGTVTFTGNSYSYTPDANYNGLDSFTVLVSDGNGGADTVVVNVTVNPVNDDPVINEGASNLTPSGDEDTDITGSIVATDVDVGDTLTYAVETGGEPLHGTVTFTGNSYSYTPDANYNGLDSFTVLVSDGNGGADTVVVNVTVNGVNDPPTAVNDTATTDEDVTAAGDVVSNDTDPDTGDTKTVTQVNGLAANVGAAILLTHGHLTIDANGAWSFVTDTAAAQALNDLDVVQETVTYQMRDAAGLLSSATLQITINGKDEIVTGTNGDDNPLPGLTPFDDQAFGLDGDDAIDSLAGDDEVFGGNGNDVLTGGAGSDLLHGGADTDTASYANAASSIFADLSAGAGTFGDAEGDTYVSIENLTGSAFGDFLYGNGLDNVLTGGDGNDVLQGGGGADVLDGGAGTADYAIYVDSTAGVTIDLENGALNSGDAGGDTFIGIERFQLTSQNDVFSGDAAANVVFAFSGDDQLNGRAGDDTLNGGAGADAYDGGAGTADFASYVNAAGPVTVNLTNLAANTGDAAGDTFVNIEGYLLTSFGDTFLGSAAGETIRGFEGDDFITGRGGRDVLRGDDGADTFIYTAIADSGVGAARDVVQDFTGGTDKIDVSVIDAASAAGIQDFTFAGTAAFTAEGQIRVVQSGGNTILEFNTVGTTGAEMSIQLNFVTATALSLSDFII